MRSGPVSAGAPPGSVRGTPSTGSAYGTSRADDRASSLPYGDERRLALARSLGSSPDFLLLDEPAAGLDDAESLALTRTIARLREELGCGVLLVEHDIRIIFRVCERIQVLDYGKAIAAGTPDEIRTNKAVIAAYLGEKGAQDAATH